MAKKKTKKRSSSKASQPRARARLAKPKKKNAPARLSAADSRKRFAALKRAGCKPQRVTLPDGTQAVVRSRDCHAPGLPMKRNPKRPPKRWFDACLASVEARKYARDPAAVCAAAWWRRPLEQRMRIVRAMERGTRRDRRTAVAIAKAEQRRADKGAPKPKGGRERRTNPRELVSLVYLEQKPGDREPYEYEHEFEGDLPELGMRGGNLQIKRAGSQYRTKKGWIHG